jgi:hypothetical protein
MPGGSFALPGWPPQAVPAPARCPSRAGLVGGETPGIRHGGVSVILGASPRGIAPVARGDRGDRKTLLDIIRVSQYSPG